MQRPMRGARHALPSIPPSVPDAIKAALADTWPVDTILDERHKDCGEESSHLIARSPSWCFSADRVEEIVEAARFHMTGAHRDWAQGVAADLKLARRPAQDRATGISGKRGRATSGETPNRRTIGWPCAASRGTKATSRVVQRVADRKDGTPRWKPDRLRVVETRHRRHTTFRRSVIWSYFSLPQREMQAAASLTSATTARLTCNLPKRLS